MKRYSLTLKFSVLLVGIVVLCLICQVAWSRHMHEQQAEDRALVHVQGIALEMDAVWDFMIRNKNQFVTNEDGRQTLYCVVAAKAIALTITRTSDYEIHYTNVTTRRPPDAPDEFELQALTTFENDRETTSYYGLSENDRGQPVFRYAEPLFIEETCLECHGSPAGELDVIGYEKEGYEVGDLAGAMSISVPYQPYLDDLNADTNNDLVFYALIVLASMAMIFVAVKVLVTRPLSEVVEAFHKVEQGDFAVTLPSQDNARDEIGNLVEHFSNMASQLETLYADLEGQVEVRTHQLAETNAMLEANQEKLQQANNQLLEDSQYRIKFLHVMSHELRTPLTSILAFSRIWQERYEPRSDEESSIMNEVGINCRRLLSMVNNILEVARSDAGRSRVDYEMVDMVDLAGELKATMGPIAQCKHIIMDVAVDEEVPLVWADGEKLLRILENLTTNAVKYTDAGGMVSVQVLFDEASDEVAMVVKDDGCGIPEEDLPVIFDSFAQAHDVSAHISNGAGLGLSVVKELVEMHGGSVAVESDYGVGSCFTVRIPCSAKEEVEIDG